MASSSTPPDKAFSELTLDTPRSGTTNRTMTGCSGVNVMGNISGQNVTLTANVTQQGSELDWMKQKVQLIHERTMTRIKTWTSGMVRTAVLEKVLKKLNKGAKWLTIRGSPGEGKTTCAYMALEELHRSGRQVFQVLSPDEYLEVTKVNPVSVIMLDDILGDLEFDHGEWLQWKSVLRQFLDAKEHRSHQLDEERENHETTLVLVGRDYVLKTASRDMGKFSDFVAHERYVVEISKSVFRDYQEKVSIWNAVVSSCGIEIDEHMIEEICSINVGHGFPHVCRLFVTAYHENEKISAVNFVQAPLKFLNNTIEKLLENDQTLSLFKEIIKGDGEISARELGRLDDSYRTIRTANDLTGTYLKKEDDYVKFDHPSIYDCVAYNLCKLYPLFAIENCKLSFIHQRLRLQQTDQEFLRSETDFVVDIPRSYMRDLAKRFAHEIENSNLFYTLSHSACTDRAFVQIMMSMITLPVDRLLNLTQFGENFLKYIASTNSVELFRYIENKIDIWKNQTGMNSVIWGMCKHAASNMLKYLTENRYKLDLNNADCTDINGSTFAMIAAKTKDVEFVDNILSHCSDMMTSNIYGTTLLHLLCENGLLSAANRTIAMGALIIVYDKYGQTPLGLAYKNEHMDIVRLLLSKGDVVDFSTIASACVNGDVEAVALFCEKGITSVMTSSDGDTPLHIASMYGQVEVMKFLVDNIGVPVNISGYSGWSPLHEACSNNEYYSALCLIQHGADIHYRNDDGDTPLRAAIDGGSTTCVDLLLESGADVNVLNKNGKTPLHDAVFRRIRHRVIRMGKYLLLPDITMSQILIRHGANVNKQDSKGNTPLHLLCRINSFTEIGRDCPRQPASSYEDIYKTLITLLIDNGADVNIHNNRGEPALRGWCQTLG